MSKNKILLQLSGSIACFKACALLSRLVQEGYDVEVVATKAALSFVGEATLEGLTGKKVHSDTFAPGEYMNHIHLMRWADLAIVCPATANTLAKMAAGIADDLLTTLFLAHDFKKPYLVAPAMNTQMMIHPATQAALFRLREWGVDILNAGSGPLACGEFGGGRLLEPDEILKEIRAKLGDKTSSVSAHETKSATGAKPMRVLITSGGTREAIDGVRSIANTSTGRTGSQLAEYFSSRGHQVTLLSAQESVQPKSAPSNLRGLSFVSFQDLRETLKKELANTNYDTVIHAAAVSDYRVESIDSSGKTMKPGPDSKIEAGDDLTLHLKRQPKIVDELRSMSKNKSLKVIAFKLTNSLDARERATAIRKLAQHAHPDFIVHNDLHEIETGGRHIAKILTGGSSDEPVEIARAMNKTELAQELERCLTERNL